MDIPEKNVVGRPGGGLLAWHFQREHANMCRPFLLAAKLTHENNLTPTMRSRILFTIVAVFTALVLTAAVSGQGIGSAEYYMRYGREYLDARKYDMAIMYFEDALLKAPESAEANYLTGLAYTKLGKPEKARPYLEKAVEIDRSYSEKAAAISGPASEKSMSDTAEYEIGDLVEVFYAGRWNPGKIKSVEGRGPTVRAEVAFTFQGDARTSDFSYNALRHAAAVTMTAAPSTKTLLSDGLTLGEYGCSSKVRNGTQWTFTPRGSFKLLPNGSYTQTSGGGRFKYVPDSKTISFTGGFFGNSGATGKVVSASQVDINFSDSYWWTCALQK
jgi:hypothetical protein